MKNTFIIILMLSFYIPATAQEDLINNSNPFRYKVKTSIPVYKNHLFTKKKEPCSGLYLNCEQISRSMTTRKTLEQKHKIFIDGPVVYSATPKLEINRNANTLYQRYSASSKEPSAALVLLGIAAGITAGAAVPKYSKAPYYPYPGGLYQTRYLNSGAAIEAAYLQSTYRQHDK